MKSPARLLLSGFLFLFAALPLFPQQRKVVADPPSLGEAERDYRNAQQEWLNADPNLEADFLKGNPREIHNRITRSAALKDEMMQKKAVYLDLVVAHFAETRARLSSAKGVDLPIPEMRQRLEAEQTRVLSEIERLDDLIRDFSQDDLYAIVVHNMNAERAQLAEVQLSLAKQIRSLDSIGNAQDAIKRIEARDPLDQKLEAISKVWEQERESVRVQREHWKNYYAEMSREVDGGKSPATVASNSPAVNPAPAPASAKPRVTPPTKAQGPAKPADFEGKWVYTSSPNAWTGFGEPVRVALELHYSGKTLSGAYTARLPGRQDVRDLDLTLSGEVVSPGKAVLRWISKTPAARGELTVQLGGDRRLLLERTTSSDTYVPRGMEVLVPQQAP